MTLKQPILKARKCGFTDGRGKHPECTGGSNPHDISVFPEDELGFLHITLLG